MADVRFDLDSQDDCGLVDPDEFHVGNDSTCFMCLSCATVEVVVIGDVERNAQALLPCGCLVQRLHNAWPPRIIKGNRRVWVLFLGQRCDRHRFGAKRRTIYQGCPCSVDPLSTALTEKFAA